MHKNVNDMESGWARVAMEMPLISSGSLVDVYFNSQQQHDASTSTNDVLISAAVNQS